MEISSPAFQNNQTLPGKYTCDGENISPVLKWKDIPDNTKTFVLIFDDPDAPNGTWTHWILYNIPAYISNLKENIDPKQLGIAVGLNSWNEQKYGGPCPPSGEHRYIFRLYALDTKLDLKAAPESKALQQLIAEHILAEASLTSKYKRNK